MNANFTLLNNPIVNGIFDIVGAINKTITITAFILLLAWYGIQVHGALAVKESLSDEQNISIDNKRYIISNVCEDVMIDYDSLEILSRKHKDNMATNCPSIDAEYIKKSVNAHNTNTHFLNGSDDLIVYGAIFILVIVFGISTMLPLILSSPFRGAIAITILWIIVSTVTFPLNFGARNISYEIVELNVSTAYISTAISNDSNSLYVYSPLVYTDFLLNLSDHEQINEI